MLILPYIVCIKTVSTTFCAGLGALLVGPGEADATLDGGGRALGRDILLFHNETKDDFNNPQCNNIL